MSARLLLRRRLKIFPLSISLKTKVFWNYFRVPRVVKYCPSSWKFPESWSKSRCALLGLRHLLVIVTKGVNMSARLLLTKRSLSISLKTKVFFK